jgi:hypothetical protein
MSTSSGNGNGSDPAEVYRRHFQSIEHYRREAVEAERAAGQLRAESERLASLAEDWEGRRLDYEARARHAGAAELDLHRSRMSAKAKSDYITAYGRAAYEALPFDDGKPRGDGDRRPTWSPNWRSPR